MLDNIPHVKVFWIMVGLKVAQLALGFGADDVDGTVAEEKITHAAGAQTPEALSVSELRRLIGEAGRIPVERDTLYQPAHSPRGELMSSNVAEGSRNEDRDRS